MKSKYECIVLCAGLLVATIVLAIGVMAMRDKIAAGGEIVIAALGIIGMLIRGIVAKAVPPKKRGH